MKKKIIATNPIRNEEIRKRMMSAASSSIAEVFRNFNTGENGLSEAEAERSREKYGDNTITRKKSDSMGKKLAGAFVNPFTAILFVLAIVSAFTDIIYAAPADRNYFTVSIISAMVIISGALRFIQETRSGNAAAKLSGMIHTTTCVERIDTGVSEVELDSVVVGDIIHLSAGDMIPADLRILAAKDLFVSQSALTGESEPVEKQSTDSSDSGSLSDISNLAFMGSNVISGSARAVVIAVGDDTMLGAMAKGLNGKAPKTSFEKGVNSVSWVLIRFMLVMVPIVLLINGFTKGSWLEASLFAISVAVGLTPEMLPMIVTTNLAKGAVAMGKRKVIVNNLNAIQNLGSIDILCTDKTGTLTQDKVVLEYHLDINGNEDERVLRHAFLNSYFQTGLKNLIDVAIIAHKYELGHSDILAKYTKVDEIPFDFSRRRMSVVVSDKTGKTQMITKGAVREMLKCCSFAELESGVVPLTNDVRDFVIKKSDELNDLGMRVIAVAHKTDPAPVGEFSAADENDMVLLGFLAFLDPPKETTAAAISALLENGVSVKILTGDNEKVTRCICDQVGITHAEVILGSEVSGLSDSELMKKAETTTVFAKLSPDEKARVVKALRSAGHSVGYMGDGINDAAAMKASDVGISVDTAVDIAKESADVILLEKDLMVLNDGVIEGRKTYANMIKYIKMTASSNFGNMLSVLTASAFLPFLPMAAIHLILLNFIYDLSCTAIPWDNVDDEFLKKPRNWDASSIKRFMLWFGPTSSIFDITTYLLMYFVICPMATGGMTFHQLSDPSLQVLYVAIFQAGWFIESMWTQALVIHMIRTRKIPFIQSHASLPVYALTFTGIAVITAIPFTKPGSMLHLSPLPLIFFGILALTVLCYMALVTAVKKLYVARYGELL